MGESKILILAGNSTNFVFSSQAAPLGGFMNATIDETGFWERELDPAEILNLFGGLGGPPPPEYGDIKIFLNSPPNDFRTISNEITFNFSVEGKNITNMTLIIDGVDNITITNSSVGLLNLSLQVTLGFSDGAFNWTGRFSQQSGIQINTTEVFIFNISDFVENSQTFNPTTTEGNSESFSANLSIAGGLTVSESRLFYGGVVSLGESFSSGENIIVRKQDFIVPNIAQNQNISFNWEIILSDLSIVNLTTQSQLVFNISLDDCSTNTHVIYNFTIVDEEDQILIPANNSIEISAGIFSFDRSELFLNFSGGFNISSIGLCFNRNLSNLTSIYSFDSVIKYSAQDHVVEYYNIVDVILNNESGIQNITLYDLLISDSTEFELSFTGTDFLPAENVLVFVERQYLSEGVFKVVELPRTDTNGQTILHLVRNDIVYNLVFIKDGFILKDFRNLRAFCDNPTITKCSISLNALSGEDDELVYDEEIGIAYENPPTYDEITNLISFSYISFDGLIKNTTMRVERRDVFGNISICSNSLNSISGTLSCNVGSGLTDTNLVTTISVDGNDKIISQVNIDSSAFGSIGYVFWFILTLGLVLVFSKDKNGILIALLISYIGAIGLGLIVGGIVGVGSAGIWLVIITLIGLWRLNKNKFD